MYENELRAKEVQSEKEQQKRKKITKAKGKMQATFSSWPDISISPSCVLGPSLLTVYNLKWVALLSRVLTRNDVEIRSGLSWGRCVPYRRKRGADRADRIPLKLIRLNRHIHIANVRPPVD